MGLGRKRARRPAGRARVAAGAAILLLALAAPSLRAQIPSSAPFDIATVLGLIGENKLPEAETLRRLAVAFGADASDLDLLLGAAFLEAKDFVKALAYLESAGPARRNPALAGAAAYAAFMTEDWSKAERYAMELLESRPDEEAACEILGSVALIRDLPARALLYWNRIGKPVLYDVVYDPPEAEALLGRALPAGKGRILRVRDWLDLRDFLARPALIGGHRLLLIPREDGLYDLRVRVEMKRPFFESPLPFLAGEAVHLLQSQIRLEWNRVAGSRNSLGLLYRFEDYRKALAMDWTHALAFGSNLDFRLAFASRDETWRPESDRAASFRQRLIAAEATGGLLGGMSDKLGLFVKDYTEPGAPRRTYLGGALQKRFRLSEAPGSRLAAFLDAGIQGEAGRIGPGTLRAFGGLFLDLSAQVGLPIGVWKGSLAYHRTWFPDRADYALLGVGPGIRLLMRGHPYILSRVGAEGEALYSKHFWLGHSQIEIDLTPRSLLDLKAVVFWDGFRALDGDAGLRGKALNDIGLGLDIGILARRIASLSIGYSIERRDISVYLGPSWSWD